MRSNHIVEFNELMNQLEINFKFLNKFNLDLNAFGFTDIIDLVDQNCDSFVSYQLFCNELKFLKFKLVLVQITKFLHNFLNFLHQ